jgi:glyceraldehyde-3-phosphate dehydrogenase (NADP+)
VGWDMKARAGRKRVVLELGGNAGVIVDRDADLEFTVTRLVTGGFTYAGQSCISVQRVYVHEALFDALAGRIVAAVDRLVIGHPLDPAADLSAMIDPAEADRVGRWVDDAIAAGARVLTGGRRVGRAGYLPTVMTDIPADARLCAEEAFAPIIGLYPFSDFTQALDAVNAGRYGLQAGVFTSSLDRAFAAFDRLEVGGVLINDVPSYRIDHMPYGGVKDSGFGREGPRFAIEDMTEIRLLIVNRQR